MHAPPHAVALSDDTAAPLHGATGTPARSASSLAAILSPSARIVAPDGPRNEMPASVTRSTKTASSATKPQPGHTASAPCPAEGREQRGRDRARRRPRRAGRRAGAPRRRGAHTARRDRPRCRARSPCSPEPSRARSVLTARRKRMAASPRLTIATRWKVGTIVIGLPRRSSRTHAKATRRPWCESERTARSGAPSRSSVGGAPATRINGQSRGRDAEDAGDRPDRERPCGRPERSGRGGDVDASHLGGERASRAASPKR